MAEVAIDSAVFSYVTEEERSRDSYVAQLIALQKVWEITGVELLVSANVWEALERGGVAPPWDEAYEGRGDRDIVTVVVGLLSRLRELEDWVGIEDILVGEATVDPDGQLSDRPPALIDDYRRTCGLVVCSSRLLPQEVLSTSVLTCSLGRVVDVEVRGRIDAIVPDDEAITPFEFEAAIRHLPDVQSLSHAFEPVRLWKNGEYENAIVVEILQSTGKDWEEWESQQCSFEVRTEFIESLPAHGFDHVDVRIQRIVRECANAVAGRDQRNTHRLRIDSGGGSPPQRRDSDGAHAWRREVDPEFRLHYWRSGDRVEFARLAPHNDFHIPE